VLFPGAQARGCCVHCNRPSTDARGHEACRQRAAADRDYRGRMVEEWGGAPRCVDRADGRCEGPIQSDHRRRLVDNGRRDITVPRCVFHHKIKSARETAEAAAKRRGGRVGTSVSVGAGRRGEVEEPEPGPRAWVRSTLGMGLVLSAAAYLAVGEVAGVAVAGLWVTGGVLRWRRQTRALCREAERVRLVQVAGRCLMTADDDIRLKVSDWAGSRRRPRARDVRIWFGSDFPTNDPIRCEAVQVEFAHRLGVPVGRLAAAWGRGEDTVRFTVRDWAEPEPEPEPVQPGEVEAARVALTDVIRGEYAVAALETDGDGVTVLEVRYPATAKDSNDDWQEQVESAVMARTGVQWAAEWRTVEHRVLLTRRPPLSTVAHYPLDAPLVEDQIPLATGGHGQIICWDLVHPHLLLVGKTRSGKTTEITDIIVGCLLRGHEMWLCDPKGTTLAGYASWPGVTRTAFMDKAEMDALLCAARDEVERRYAAIRAGAEPEDFRRLVVVIDEAAVMQVRLAEWWASLPRKRDDPRPKVAPGLEAWREIARLGAEARVHLVLSIQQANAKFMDGTEARENFGARAAFGRLSEESADMAFGNSQIGRTTPRIRGRGVFETDIVHDEPVDGQGFYLPSPRPNGVIRDEHRALLEPLLARIAAAQGTGAPAPAPSLTKVPVEAGQQTLRLVPAPPEPLAATRADDIYPGEYVEVTLPDGEGVFGVVQSVDDGTLGRVVLWVEGRDDGVDLDESDRVRVRR
jgi:hypothetical protein